MRNLEEIKARLESAERFLARANDNYDEAQNEGLRRLIKKDIYKWEARIETFNWVLNMEA